MAIHRCCRYAQHQYHAAKDCIVASLNNKRSYEQHLELLQYGKIAAGIIAAGCLCIALPVLQVGPRRYSSCAACAVVSQPIQRCCILVTGSRSKHQLLQTYIECAPLCAALSSTICAVARCAVWHGRRTMSFSIRCLRADDQTGLTRSARTFHDPSCRSGALVISKSAYMWLCCNRPQQSE